MEILRLGNEVKVLHPLSQIEQIKSMHKKHLSSISRISYLVFSENYLKSIILVLLLN